jgi:hypothetical protein
MKYINWVDNLVIYKENWWVWVFTDCELGLGFLG